MYAMAPHHQALVITLAGVLLHYSPCLISVSAQPLPQPAEPLFPAFFIFGDSLVDCGNNNYITLTLAKANIPPNGIDFPTHRATGRFCNGKTSHDVLADYIGLPYPPPAVAPASRGFAILRGLNYGSGAGGILDETGANYIDRLSMNEQISLFQQTVNQLNAMLGPSAATDLLRNSLFTSVMGSNDYVNNYLLTSNNSTRNQYTPSQYVQLLVSTYRTQLTTIYNLGARKFVVFNVGPLGCIPSRLALGSIDGSCVAADNELVVSFNTALKPLTLELTRTLPESIFLYGNSYDAVYDLILDPFPAGFNVVNEGCCGGGEYNGQLPCLPVVDQLCSNRDEYVFWDAFHPTQAVNEVLGFRSFGGPISDISPMNVQQLSRLRL
ncbi:GDSL esterase/lipase At1g71250 [Physcomitrium patens]|uniref:Uncharacterized protein n=1 Tax=Physcomitrium patens TaxID=3218 RepID=A0A2K1JZM8_PHYPA|nr:GDSL esterase/lipase At1g71250-like [Physcomitrium patens]PNR46981.1 hypothetical protein PHYPA_014101 [Physcomitrium patens]|eukprot:XP_024385964.1 GDSL esterase/lipase At1g71250-like [Physcomitrella patens]